MPGTNLTREEAKTRAALLDVDSYTVELDLTTSEKTFASKTTIRFTCREAGASTFADLVDATVHEITLNGRSIDPASAYVDSRIQLDDLALENELVVRADCTYSHSGEGLHRFVDPVDDRVYTYSQFEVPDARRVYTTFEQPDLKSVFDFVVTAPDNWVVVSNAPTPEPVSTSSTNGSGSTAVSTSSTTGDGSTNGSGSNAGSGAGTGSGDGTGKAVWRFPTTKRMSTYITAIIAGEYHGVFDTYQGKFNEIRLGHYCRQSLVPYLDREELVKLTSQSFEYFESAFDMAYPFEKYDQLYVPEYNMGAMENAGAVTLRDEYLPRSRQPRSFYEFRCSVILHEMAHMWFGDLVTMKWWDDLWLNESFAEWACYQAEAENTEFKEAWTGFANARKQTGYRADQLPSTHPIAADNYDLEAVEVNFDMITYAKGASVLKQLVAWVGLEPFLAGLRQYFKDHAYANSEFSDLLSALEKSSGRELTGWAKEWLQTAGVNTLSPEIVMCEPCDDDTMSSVTVRQTAPADHPTLRRHRLGIGLYDDVDGRLVRRQYVEVDIAGEATEIEELAGAKRPDLLLLNDEDHAYAKIRLDDRSLSTVIDSVSRIDDSLARALCWGSAWDMTRDAEMSATDFVTLVLSGIAEENDPWGISRIPTYAAQAVNVLSDPAHREELRSTWAHGLRKLAEEAAPGSDHQLAFTRAFASAAATDGSQDDVQALLDGSLVFDGLALDTDLKWALLAALARAGRATEDQIAAMEAEDGTISGKEHAAAARAACPTAEAKAAAWAQIWNPETPNETARSIAVAFMQPGQEDVLEPYVAKYLEAAETAWETIGAHKAGVAMEALFPRVLATQEVVDRARAWLETTGTNPGAKRYVAEGIADVERSLRAQERDAQH